MTERAKRAMEELKRRGWGMRDDYEKHCNVCDYLVSSSFKYCPQCGNEMPANWSAETIEDIEAAIAAAVD